MPRSGWGNIFGDADQDTKTLVDTRDRVIDLSARFDDLEARVTKTSRMVEDLHAAFLQAQGAGTTAKLMWAAWKFVFAGATWLAAWTWLSDHLRR